MSTQPLFYEQSAPANPMFAGADYVPDRDEARLERQVDRVLVVILDNGWMTIERLVSLLRKRYPGVRFPENSVQAQLRNLRKVGYRVNKQRSGAGLYEYMVLQPENPGVGAKARKVRVN